MVESNFISPVYNTIAVPVEQIVAQEINPNTLDKKAFSALQMSIFNSGFTMPPTGCLNEDYDEKNEAKYDKIERVKRHIEGTEDNERSGGQAINFATNISDKEFRKSFKYELIDGAQRTGIIRLGAYYMWSQKGSDKLAKDWSKGINIPNKPGKMMLMYLAWRENFKVPMSMNKNKSEIEKMSITVLSNVAKGNHSFKIVQEMVVKLIENGCTKEWISQNMFIDIDAIDRILQLNGISEAFKNYDEVESWIPENDQNYIDKENAYLDRIALKYLLDFVERNKKLIKENNINSIYELREVINGKEA